MLIRANLFKCITCLLQIIPEKIAKFRIERISKYMERSSSWKKMQ